MAGGDIAEGGMKPLTIVISFDARVWFLSCRTGFHWGIAEAIAFPAHRLDHPGGIEDLVVIGGGILAATIRAGRGRWANSDGCRWCMPGTAAAPLPLCHDDA